MTIADDPSISRVHAEIIVKKQKPDDAALAGTVPTVLVRDLGKFHTRVDGRKVGKSSPDGAVALPCAAGKSIATATLVFGCKTPTPTTATLTHVPIVLHVLGGEETSVENDEIVALAEETGFVLYTGSHTTASAW